MEPATKPALQSGINSLRSNITILMQPPVSRPRKKAIHTIARKNNISNPDAQFRQARHIAEYYARKDKEKS